MKTPVLISFSLAVLLMSASVSHSADVILDKPIQQNNPAKDLERLIEHIKNMETIKIGMTRENLEKYFALRTGMTGITKSEPSVEHYRYKQCPYIWVDVVFAREGQNPPHKYDKILKISKPYLISKTEQ